MMAVRNGDKETVSLLIENGADLRTKTIFTTPVYIARDLRYDDIKRLLIEKGAPEDPGVFWKFKRSVLDCCCWTNSIPHY